MKDISSKDENRYDMTESSKALNRKTECIADDLQMEYAFII